MNCTLENRETFIDLYLLRKLPEAETEAFEQHFFSCRECAEELSVRRHLIEALKQEKRDRDAGAPVSRRIARYWPYLAAAAVLAIGVIWVPRLFNSSAPERNAENFVANRQLENAIEQNLKNLDIVITALSPGIGEKLNKKIVFAWEAEHNNEPYTGSLDLVIMNNRHLDVFKKTIQGNRFQMESKLIPGLYYWTLEYNHETVYIGKFFVGKS